jgi:hypothetical protein
MSIVSTLFSLPARDCGGSASISAVDGQSSAVAVRLACNRAAGTIGQVMKDEEAFEGHARLMFEGR